MADMSWISFAIGLAAGIGFGLVVRTFGRMSDRRFQRRLAANNQEFLTKLQLTREQIKNTHQGDTNGR